jgi:hypothetical protein
MRLTAIVLLLAATAALAADNKPAPTQRTFSLQAAPSVGPDQKGFLQLSGNTCYKLQKYVFRREDGSDRTTLVGSTDCTRASRVTTEKAADPNPQPTGPSLQKAIVHLHPLDPGDRH